MIIGKKRKMKGDGKEKIGNERKRMRRVDGKRSKEREDSLKKMVLKKLILVFRKGGREKDIDILILKIIEKSEKKLMMIRMKEKKILKKEIKMIMRCEKVGDEKGYEWEKMKGKKGNEKNEEIIEIGRRDGKEE